MEHRVLDRQPLRQPLLIALTVLPLINTLI